MLGAFTGGTLGSVAGAVAGIVYATRFVEPGLERLGPYLVGMVVGAWLGGAVGVTAALRARRHDAPVATGLLCLLFAPPVCFAGFRLSETLSRGGAGDGLGAVPRTAPFVAAVALAVLAARWLALRASGTTDVTPS